jgi:hypothetical protein
MRALVDNAPDHPDRVLGRDARLNVHIREQSARYLIRSAHRHLLFMVATPESDLR